MKITGISAQTKNKNRINVMVDGSYRFSLDIYQYADLGIRVGKEYTEEELDILEAESQFGKVYARALEYCLMRPHSAKEVREYLYKRTRSTLTKTGEIKQGVSPEITVRVLERLTEKGYVDNEKFVRFWVENRHQAKGVSRRKLTAELQSKGIGQDIIASFLESSSRSEHDELKKVIAKKRSRYLDDQKLMQYLVRQGFTFDDVKHALAEISD